MKFRSLLSLCFMLVAFVLLLLQSEADARCWVNADGTMSCDNSSSTYATPARRIIQRNREVTHNAPMVVRGERSVVVARRGLFRRSARSGYHAQVQYSNGSSGQYQSQGTYGSSGQYQSQGSYGSSGSTNAFRPASYSTVEDDEPLKDKILRLKAEHEATGKMINALEGVLGDVPDATGPMLPPPPTTSEHARRNDELHAALRLVELSGQLIALK